MTRMTLTLAVALATGFTGSAIHALPGDLIRPADQNGDGIVTVAEAKAEASARLRRIDADGDGVLTRAEFRAYREQARAARHSQRFELIDADRDGQITQSELSAYQHAMVDRSSGRHFAALDADGDGRVSRAEFLAAPQRLQQARKAARLARAEADGDAPIRRGEAMGRAGVRQRWRDVDSNGDGRWQIAELEAAAHARIEASDRNGNGILEADERPGWRWRGDRRG